MLVYPKNASNNINIVGIDPGTTCTGVAILTIDVSTMKIVRTKAMTFNSDKMLSEDEYLTEPHSERMCKIIAQKNNLIRLFRYHLPSYICCESPFFNRLRPSAFGPLMEILSAIQMASVEYNPLVKFTLYPPSIIKKALGGSGLANKDAVRNQLLLRDDLEYNGDYPLDKLDEHSLDAIAVGICHFNLLKKGYISCLS